MIHIAALATVSSGASTAAAQSEGFPPAPVVQLESEAAPRLIVAQPLASQLEHGRVVIQYRAENLRIQPVFGTAALGVSPRIGHIHVTVDDAPFRWADASGEPLIINGLPPGPHKVLIELVDPTHKTLERQVVNFIIPERPASR